MKQFLRHVAGVFYSLYIGLKGGRELAIFSREDKYIGELAVMAIQGFRIEIHCRELKYTYSFSNRLFPQKNYTLYSLYGEITGQAPERLREVLSRKSIVPSILPTYVPWALTRKYIVEAYLDMVNALLISTARAEARSGVEGMHHVDATVFDDDTHH